MSFPRYPKYKDSGVEWLGQVPEHWEVKRLKRACHVFPSNVDKKTYNDETPAKLCNYTDVYYTEAITAKWLHGRDCVMKRSPSSCVVSMSESRV